MTVSRAVIWNLNFQAKLWLKVSLKNYSASNSDLSELTRGQLTCKHYLGMLQGLNRYSLGCGPPLQI